MRVLIAYPAFPEADTNAGGQRLFEIVRMLVEQGHEVTFLAQDENGGPHRARLEAIGTRCVTETGDRVCESSACFAAFLQEGRFDRALLVHYFVYNRYATRIRAFLPSCRCILDTVDLHFVRAEREAAIHDDPALRETAQMVRQHECQAILDADSVWVVTAAERDVAASVLGTKSVPIHVVPTIHRPLDHAPAYGERRGIVFLGGYRHSPNVDAMHYFMREIRPRIREQLPDTPITIAGSHPPDEFAQFPASDPLVSVTGFVQDHRAVLSAHRVGIAPLRFGAGIKGKIGEYFACGLPTVTSSIGAEGMGLVHGTEAMIADDPAEFAGAVVRLYRDERAWQAMSEACRAHLEGTQSPSAVAHAVLEGIERAAPYQARGRSFDGLSRVFTRPGRWMHFIAAALRAFRAGGFAEFNARRRLWARRNAEPGGPSTAPATSETACRQGGP